MVNNLEKHEMDLLYQRWLASSGYDDRVEMRRTFEAGYNSCHKKAVDYIESSKRDNEEQLSHKTWTKELLMIYQELKLESVGLPG